MHHTTRFYVALTACILALGLITPVLAQDEPVEPGPEPALISAETAAVTAAAEAVKAIELDEDIKASDLDVQEPASLPGTTSYFFKNIGRSLKAAFTFDPVKKANLISRYADEKLIEAKKLAETQPEKTKQIAKAFGDYKKEGARLEKAAERIKEKADENPKVGKFLDKFVRHQVLHEKILEKLEETVPEQTFDTIKEIREKHLERLGNVMQKLEDKTKIHERLEKNLEDIKGSEFKNFKNLELLKRIEEKAPEQMKEAVKNARENTLQKLNNKLEQMPVEAQDKFKVYIEKIKGIEENKMEILENIKTIMQEKRPEMKQKLEQAKEKMQEKIEQRKTKPSPSSIKPMPAVKPAPPAPPAQIRKPEPKQEPLPGTEVKPEQTKPSLIPDQVRKIMPKIQQIDIEAVPAPKSETTNVKPSEE